MAESKLGRPIYRECRACLKIGESSGFVDMFLETEPAWCRNKDTTIAEELTRISRVQISNTDKCSDVLCFSCCFKLHHASQFITMVQESDKIIKSRVENPLTNAKNWPKPIQLETEINEVILSNVSDVEIKQEVLSEEDNDLSDSIDGVDIPELQMEIKIEPEEIVQSGPIKVTVNGTITADQMKDMSNGCEIYYDEEYLTEHIKDEPLSDEEESGTFDLPLECMLCAKRFLSVAGLKAHVVACHSYKSVRRRTGAEHSPAKQKQRHICSICRRCFWTLTDLMVHETCHNKFHCYGCQKTFDSFGALLKHRQRCIASNTQNHQVRRLEDAMRSSPTKVFVRKNLIPCSNCEEKFTDEYYMNVHNEVHHSSSNTELGKVLSETNENTRIPAEDKDKRTENTSEPAQENDKEMETTCAVDEEKDCNKMVTESLELEMLKIHEETNSTSSNKNEGKEKTEDTNMDVDNKTASEKITIDKSLKNVEDPETNEERLKDINVKDLTGSNNHEDKIESVNQNKQEPETVDDVPNSETNGYENDDTTKLESTVPVEENKSMIEIKFDTEIEAAT